MVNWWSYSNSASLMDGPHSCSTLQCCIWSPARRGKKTDHPSRCPRPRQRIYGGTCYVCLLQHRHGRCGWDRFWIPSGLLLLGETMQEYTRWSVTFMYGCMDRTQVFTYCVFAARHVAAGKTRATYTFLGHCKTTTKEPRKNHFALLSSCFDYF